MSVLSKREIDERRKLPVSEPDSLVITPLLEEDAFDEESVDLRLARMFLTRIPWTSAWEPTS